MRKIRLFSLTYLLMMFKKITTIFFILLANIIMLAHVVIPHHHHVNDICLEDSVIETQIESHCGSDEHRHACENHFKHHAKNNTNKSQEKPHEERSHFCPLIMVQAIIDDSSKIEIKSSKGLSLQFQNVDLALCSKNTEGVSFINCNKKQFPKIKYSYFIFASSGMGLRGPPQFV